MVAPIKTIFLDIDGTLLRSDHSLSERVVRSVKNLNPSEILVVLASGRSWEGVRPIYNTLGLSGPSICCNGAFIVANSDGRCIYEKTLDDRVSRSIIFRARKCGMELLAFKERELIYEFRRHEIDNYHKRVNMPGKIVDFDDFEELNLTKCVGLANHDQLSMLKSELEKEFTENHLYATYSYRTCLELLAGGINKGTGLMKICKTFNLKPSETAAIGNDWNDLPLLERAENSWIMGNASQELKALFPENRILPDTDEDGATQVLESLLM